MGAGLKKSVFYHTQNTIVALYIAIEKHSRNPQAYLKILVFSSQKALLHQTVLVLGQKKGAFSISDVAMALKSKRRLLDAFFRFFAKLCFFSKIKGAFYLNCAPALHQTAAPFFQKVWTFSFHWKKNQVHIFFSEFFRKV